MKPRRRSYWHGHRYRPKIPGKGRIQRWPYEQRLTEAQWWRLFVVTQAVLYAIMLVVLWLAFG